MANQHIKHPLSVEQRFWLKVDKTPGQGPKGDCWTWQGAPDGDGYGMVKVNRKTIRAHRLAYLLANGNAPDTQMVLHGCDNPPCCNPAHLFLGSNAANVADRDQKGRQTRGERHPSAKLTREQVGEIKRALAAGQSCYSLGKQYGVREWTIHCIKAGRSWRHL